MILRCHLRAARGRRTLADVAAASGVATPYISQIESGRRVPTDAEIAALAEVYELPLEEWYEFQPPQFVLVEVDPKDEL